MKNIEHTFVVCAYKESEYIEDCILSLLNQTVKSEILLATSTPSDFLFQLSQKYKLDYVINTGKSGIGYDFDFALKQGKTKYVTIAHQDDKYCPRYTEEIMRNISDESIIAFTDYYEERESVLDDNNKNLKIKKILLYPLRFKKLTHLRIIKRSALRLGCAICCPAVTFNTDKVSTPLFGVELKCDIDWYAWEKLSKQTGRFTYIHQPLMIHKIHKESTTTKILENNERTQEDYLMFKKFWPSWIAKILCKVYSNSEKSNRD